MLIFPPADKEKGVLEVISATHNSFSNYGNKYGFNINLSGLRQSGCVYSPVIPNLLTQRVQYKEPYQFMADLL